MTESVIYKVLKSGCKINTKGDLTMKAKVMCRTVEKGQQAFFVKVDRKEYFLFQQEFRKSVKDFFQNGVSVNATNNYSSAHSTAVRRTLDKLPSYLHYIEKEYDVEIYEKTKEARSVKRMKPYKRQAFRWQDYAWAV